VNPTQPRSATLPWRDLRNWYTRAMQTRVHQLESLLTRLTSDDPEVAGQEIREIARRLRGSGASFRFPRVSMVASEVEVAPDEDLVRRTEGLIRLLRPLAFRDPLQGSPHRWLLRVGHHHADEESVLRAPTHRQAWETVARSLPGGGRELASLVADRFSLPAPEMVPRPGPVPTGLRADATGGADWFTLAVDDEEVTVASSCPVDLEDELEIRFRSGRAVHWLVVQPQFLDHLRQGMGLDPSLPEEGRSVGEVSDGVVLVADDDPTTRLLVSQVLTGSGLTVEEAHGGESTLARMTGVGSPPVRLLIVDLAMPDLSGREVVQALRSKGDQTPILVLTGEEGSEVEVELLEQGASDFLRKPPSPPLLLARTRALLRR
jgi:CheY-like chemotaxis protein/HPt (histidine-containing phosphotransfer) domain-containing protein